MLNNNMNNNIKKNEINNKDKQEIKKINNKGKMCVKNLDIKNNINICIADKKDIQVNQNINDKKKF